jgi:hypothetical protein
MICVKGQLAIVPQWGLVLVSVLASVAIIAALLYFALLLADTLHKQHPSAVRQAAQTQSANQSTFLGSNSYIRVMAMSPVDDVERSADNSYDEDIEHHTIVDESGEVVEVLKGINRDSGMALIARYNKSFTAKYVQLSDESKGYYNELKNEIMSYKRTRSRVSWKYDNIHAGRFTMARFAVRGKTLCVYFALNPDDFAGSKYKVERSDTKKFQDVPLLYRITNPRRVKYAKELMAQVAAKYSVEKGPYIDVSYYKPYENTSALMSRHLIREYLVEENYDDFLKRKEEVVASSRDSKNDWKRDTSSSEE